MSKKIVFAALLLGGMSLTSARAQSFNDSDLSQGFQLKAQALSFGGAYRALADGNAAILLNPAGIAQKKGQISLAGDYAWQGATRSHAFGASVSDYAATELLALALEYDRDNPSIGGVRAVAQQITVAAAREFGLFYLGGAIKGYFTSVNSPIASGPQGVDVDLGLLVKPIPMLSLALTGQNLIRGQEFEAYPLILGMGVALTLAPHGRLAIDMTKNFNTPRPNDLNAYFGAELRAMDGIYLRGGFGLDKIRDNNFYTLGTSIVGPKISLLFAYARHLSPTSNTFSTNIELYF